MDGVHFERATHGLRDIGWKALATALSDLAAMGAEAGEAYVSVVLPADVDEPLELIHGMEELASATGVTIAGGDVVTGPVLVADRGGDRLGGFGGRARGPRRRAAGDLVGVTGELGGSEAGRRALEAGATGSALGRAAPAARPAARGGARARGGGRHAP